MMAPYVAVGTPEVEQILRTRMTNTFVFPEGMLTTANEVDRDMVGKIKELILNLATLLWETLH